MKCTSALLADVTVRVLEEAAMMVAEPTPGSEPDEAELEARLSFEAPMPGWIRLRTRRAFAEAAAANLAGEEPGTPSARARAADALGELLNMLAGVLAGELLGPDRPCRLGVPAVEAAVHPPAVAEVETWLQVDDEHRVRVGVAQAECEP